jgi:hypothetical protein
MTGDQVSWHAKPLLHRVQIRSLSSFHGEAGLLHMANPTQAASAFRVFMDSYDLPLGRRASHNSDSGNPGGEGNSGGEDECRPSRQ